MALQMFACTVTQNLCHVSFPPAQSRQLPSRAERDAREITRFTYGILCFLFCFIFYRLGLFDFVSGSPRKLKAKKRSTHQILDASALRAAVCRQCDLRRGRVFWLLLFSIFVIFVHYHYGFGNLGLIPSVRDSNRLVDSCESSRSDVTETPTRVMLLLLFGAAAARRRAQYCQFLALVIFIASSRLSAASSPSVQFSQSQGPIGFIRETAEYENQDVNFARLKE